jgi:hypothetical protein
MSLSMAVVKATVLPPGPAQLLEGRIQHDEDSVVVGTGSNPP